MSSTNLKILACITMLIDHLGAVFFQEYDIFRIIGRLAFPIFAFLIAEGFFHTHNIKKYLIRLAVSAIISEIPFNLAFNGNIFELGSGLNIFFTLFLGLLSIYIYDNYKRNGLYFVFLIGIIAELLNTDYGILGVIIIFSFYYYNRKFNKQALSYIVITLLLVVVDFASYQIINLQIFSILALIALYFYNNKKGVNLKYLFYIFYPGHLLILGLLKCVL
ncbi:conjugal transfer protein TraX [Vallitalea longa]|uniref:Conjugal transfer protein TraX n=1 Tax=Vallitalea longa TaxID=2936439 RepID=A0A9W6DHW1_9FIRM|nr:TraX family protein [Vallitalea longa]GKX31264.1 conjugal transfer protein TraX [Vallitalea longa]